MNGPGRLCVTRVACVSPWRHSSLGWSPPSNQIGQLLDLVELHNTIVKDSDDWKDPAYRQDNGAVFTAAMLANTSDEPCAAAKSSHAMVGHARFCLGQYSDKNQFGHNNGNTKFEK